jgi:hypothetical protein
LYDFASSGFDRTDVFQIGAIYVRPFVKDSTGAIAAAVKRWQLNTIFAAFSSTPYSIGGERVQPSELGRAGDVVHREQFHAVHAQLVRWRRRHDEYARAEARDAGLPRPVLRPAAQGDESCTCGCAECRDAEQDPALRHSAFCIREFDNLIHESGGPSAAIPA